MCGAMRRFINPLFKHFTVLWWQNTTVSDGPALLPCRKIYVSPTALTFCGGKVRL